MGKLLGRNIINIAGLACFTALLAGLSGCWSGFDYSALELEPQNAIDYVDLAREKKVHPGTVQYALISSSPGSSEIIRQLDDYNKDVVTQIEALDGLGQKFSGQDRDRHKQWITELRAMMAKITQATKEAEKLKSYKSAADLVDAVGQGDIEWHKTLAQYEQKIPADSKEQLVSVNGPKISEALKTMYQQSLLLAQAVPQREALDFVAQIDTALKSMKFELEKNPKIVSNPNLANAKKSLVDAENALAGVRTEISRMTSKVLVYSSLSQARDRLSPMLDNVDTNFVKSVEVAAPGSSALDEVKKLFAQIRSAFSKIGWSNN